MDFISLPREPISYPFSDFKHRKDELLPYFHFENRLNDRLRLYVSPEDSLKNGIISIFKDDIAKFEGNFKNSFIYGFEINIPDYFQRSKMIAELTVGFSRDKPTVSQKEVNRIIDEEIDKHWPVKTTQRKYNQTLYDFIDKNLNFGEFVEIYSVWHEQTQEIHCFEPPKTERTIKLQDLIIYCDEHPLNSPETDITKSMHKVTIIK